MTDPITSPEEELLPMKDVKALFVSEEGKRLTRKEVYIKNGDKVRRVLEAPPPPGFLPELACLPHLFRYRKPAVRETLQRPQAMRRSKLPLRWSPPGSSAQEGWIPMLTPIHAKVRWLWGYTVSPQAQCLPPTASLFYRRFRGPSHCSQEKPLHSSKWSLF